MISYFVIFSTCDFLRFCAIAFWWCYQAFSFARYLLFACSVWVVWVFRFFLPGPSSLYRWTWQGHLLIMRFFRFACLFRGTYALIGTAWHPAYGDDSTKRRKRRGAFSSFLYERSICMAWWRCFTIFSDFVLYIHRVSIPDFPTQILFYLYTRIVETEVQCTMLGLVTSFHVSYVYQGFVLELDWYLMCSCFGNVSIEWSVWYLYSQFGCTSNATPSPKLTLLNSSIETSSGFSKLVLSALEQTSRHWSRTRTPDIRSNQSQREALTHTVGY